MLQQVKIVIRRIKDLFKAGYNPYTLQHKIFDAFYLGLVVYFLITLRSPNSSVISVSVSLFFTVACWVLIVFLEAIETQRSATSQFISDSYDWSMNTMFHLDLYREWNQELMKKLTPEQSQEVASRMFTEFQNKKSIFQKVGFEYIQSEILLNPTKKFFVDRDLAEVINGSKSQPPTTTH